MKAISLWQPWASAMQRGQKHNETRSWPTSYRGDLLICSAKRMPTRNECGDEWTWAEAMSLPYGFALCIVELVACVRTETCNGISQMERDLGDYTPGRWAWLTNNLRVFTEPIPMKGSQGLWNITQEQAEILKKKLNFSV